MSPTKPADKTQAKALPQAKQLSKAGLSLKLSPKRVRLVLFGILGIVVVLFLFTASAGLKKLSAKSQQLVDIKLKSKTADAQLASLEVAKKQVEKYSYFNDIAKTVIPSDKDQAQAVLDIFKLADQSGISLASIAFPASSLGVASVSPSGATSATSSTTSTISQAKPVTGIKGLYSLQLIITPLVGPSVPANKVVTYSKFLDFLRRIEHDRRTAQITQVNIQPQGNDSGPGNGINFTLVTNIFMRPQQ